MLRDTTDVRAVMLLFLLLAIFSISWTHCYLFLYFFCIFLYISCALHFAHVSYRCVRLGTTVTTHRVDRLAGVYTECVHAPSALYRMGMTI